MRRVRRAAGPGRGPGALPAGAAAPLQPERAAEGRADACAPFASSGRGRALGGTDASIGYLHKASVVDCAGALSAMTLICIPLWCLQLV